MKVQRISNGSEIQALRVLVGNSINSSVSKFQELLRSASAFDVVSRMRFQPIGCDPLDESRPLNLIEQVNQTFTYLATLDAADWLFQRHPDAVPLILNLGTAKGSDIESADGTIVAEVFAAVTPNNNRKLAKDIAKAAEVEDATHKYVFYSCPEEPAAPFVRDLGGVLVTVVPLRVPCESFSIP